MSLFHRSSEKKAKAMLWLELKAPEQTEPVDKKILNALAGKGEPLTAEADVAEFLSYDWSRIKNLVYEFATGAKPCLMPYFQRILDTYPNSALSLLSRCEGEMAKEPRLLYYARFKENAERLAREAERLLPRAEAEERTLIFQLLGKCPSERGCNLLVKALEDADWRVAMKAASALAETGEARYGDAVAAAAAQREPGIAKGMEAIALQLKAKGTEADETDA